MDEVSQIREKTDIVSFIQEYIPLKKAGRNFKANCPFHNEKTPSFMVNPERQRWKCFGCQKGGDIYTFLMEYERLEFPEALRMLAKRAGVELTARPVDAAQRTQKERIYSVNNLAREYYHYILTKHRVGRKASEYLEKRGVTSRLIDTFMLGFAPGDGVSLSDYLLKKKKFPPQDLYDAGLAANYGGRVRDFFRDRLIFPLIDHRDNTVGFAGRLLDANAAVAKYINTRDTLVYHKGEHVFGLNITKDAIRKANHVILCEGEFDVISCFHHGITNVVGVKGTALTENQVNLLKRFAEKVTFAFDGDKAGQEAIIRSLPLIEKKDLASTVIEIPFGKDPDEALQKEPGSFKKAVREDQPAYDYLLTKAAAAFDPETAEGKKQITDRLLPLFSNIKNEIIKEHYLKKAAGLLDTSYESIQRETQRLIVREQPRVPKVSPESKRSKEETLEEYLLSLIIQSDNPKTVLEKALSILSDSMSKDRARQKILYHLLDHFTQTDSFDGKKFINVLPSELIESYDSSLLYPVPNFEDQTKLLTEVEKKAKELRARYIHKQMKDLAREIKVKEQEGKSGEAEELKKKYSGLSSRLNVQKPESPA